VDLQEQKNLIFLMTFAYSFSCLSIKFHQLAEISYHTHQIKKLEDGIWLDMQSATRFEPEVDNYSVKITRLFVSKLFQTVFCDILYVYKH